MLGRQLPGLLEVLSERRAKGVRQAPGAQGRLSEAGAMWAEVLSKRRAKGVRQAPPASGVRLAP
eukprot:3791991-Rhodomonas_salina.1